MTGMNAIIPAFVTKVTVISAAEADKFIQP